MGCKESFFCNKPCVTVREETEWVELVEANGHIVPARSFRDIIKAVENASGPRELDRNSTVTVMLAFELLTKLFLI